jgi:tetratricopeptide (TPR) repeat protein
VQAYMMSGEYENARHAARRCARVAPMLEAYVAIRFRQWPAIHATSGDWTLLNGMRAAFAGNTDVAERDARTLDAMGDDRSKLSAALIRAKAAALAGDHEKEITALERAVSLQDLEGYGEPPPYFFPIRESLGGAYFRAGRYAEAERVFRADLTKNPLNPRSLFGLSETLRREGRLDQADEAQRQFATAWRYADSSLDMKEL